MDFMTTRKNRNLSRLQFYIFKLVYAVLTLNLMILRPVQGFSHPSFTVVTLRNRSQRGPHVHIHSIPSSESATNLYSSTKYNAASSSESTAMSFPFQFFYSLERAYDKTTQVVKCPFFKRRISDTIDNLAMILRFILLRHKSILTTEQIISLDQQYHRLLYGVVVKDDHSSPPVSTSTPDDHPYISVIPGCRAIGRHVLFNEQGKVIKHKHLSLSDIQQVIYQDWSVHNDKGYYITGRLNSTIYRDDCLFDGPDPDLPVRGLRKYLNAASQLFDTKHSRATLLDIQIVSNGAGQKCDKKKNQNDWEYEYGARAGAGGIIQVHWKINGVLMLPWHPTLPEWTGWTKYHLDEDGLVVFHEEGWDISVVEAFVKTLTPQIGYWIWSSKKKVEEEDVKKRLEDIQ